MSVQRVDLADKDLRAAIKNTFRELKENTFKELKESMVIVTYKTENIIRIHELLKRKELNRNSGVEKYNY